MQDWLGLGREAPHELPVHPWRQLEMGLTDGQLTDALAAHMKGRDRDLLQVICPDKQRNPGELQLSGISFVLTVNTYILCLIL